MKKSLVVLLAVVFTLAIASATIAADLSYWAGGDMYFYFDSNERGLLESNGTFMVDGGMPMVKVTNGNTWAQAWMNIDKWRTTTGTGSGMWRFAFGWTKIGDVLDLGFSTKDTGTCNIGQVSITDSFNTFHADPIFNTYDNPYAINAVLSIGNLAIKAEYNVAPIGAQTLTSNEYNIAGNADFSIVAKTDSGEVHFGYKKVNGLNNPYLAMIGGAFAVGDSSIKVDIWKDHGSMHQDWGGYTAVGTYANDGGDLGIAGNGVGTQINFGYGNANFTFFYNNPEAALIANEIGLQLSYRMDKLTLEGKFFKDYNGTDNAWMVDGLYNVGAFDVKFGAMDLGGGDDTSLILGFHAALW